MRFIFDADLKIWKKQAPVICVWASRVFTDVLMLCFCSDQAAGHIFSSTSEWKSSYSPVCLACLMELKYFLASISWEKGRGW